jgi:hypothetical protein
MEKLTHWRKLRNPKYMGAYSMPTDKSEVILTIKSVHSEEAFNADGKKGAVTVITWQESNWKPLVLNSKNGTTIQKLAKTGFIEKWVGLRVQLYLTTEKHFGEFMEVVRIRSFHPKEASNEIPNPVINDFEIKDAIDKLNTCTTEDALTAMFRSFTPQMQKIEAIIKEAKMVKDMIKATE